MNLPVIWLKCNCGNRDIVYITPTIVSYVYESALEIRDSGAGMKLYRGTRTHPWYVWNAIVEIKIMCTTTPTIVYVMCMSQH